MEAVNEAKKQGLIEWFKIEFFFICYCLTRSSTAFWKDISQSIQGKGMPYPEYAIKVI